MRDAGPARQAILCFSALLVALLVAGCATPRATLSISGTASYRERMALPPDAVFEATLEEVSRADAPAAVVASVQVASPAVPIAFTIAIDPARIVASRRYAVRGRITVDGQVLFSSDAAYPVLGAGDARRIDPMLLRRAAMGDARRLRGLYRYLADAASFFDCTSGDQFPVLDGGAGVALQRAYLAARATPGAPMLATIDARIVARAPADGGAPRPALEVERFVAIAPQAQCEVIAAGSVPLEGTTWKLVALRGQPVAAVDPLRQPQLVLQPEQHRVGGSGGCNRITGGYTLAGDRLTFGRTAATMMACADGMAQERAFLDALSTVARWQIDSQRLALRDARGEVVLRFDAEPAR
ncbi:MAG TPA: META domain-containing protein [Burkholderiaceae bacterium]|nr:META domain-containing protein [Burkholderiaceae bacterium]